MARDPSVTSLLGCGELRLSEAERIRAEYRLPYRHAVPETSPCGGLPSLPGKKATVLAPLVRKDLSKAHLALAREQVRRAEIE
jgi:hypothetical protein